ncbi:MAG TPA: L,D-transpeptidase family protein [Rubricoccaceae bacterium]|jgi:hypothetical protein
MSKLPLAVRLSALALFALLAVPAVAQDATAQDFASGGAPRPASVRRAPDPSRAPAFYVVERGATLRTAPSESAPAVETLRLREGVRVLTDTLAGGLTWHEVQFSGTRGYVRAEALSNVWIRVDKSDRTMFVYRGAELVRELPADVATAEGDKVRRSGLHEPDQWRMPEGVFYVTGRNARSSYYRAFVLSYPDPVHALRGLEQGIITEAQYQAIVRADAEGVAPPMGTGLGGMIEIHGSGSGRREAWTRGCVALRNVHMDELWEYVGVGTPVVIEP